MIHKLPDLPYSADEIPGFSMKSFNYHYGKHHKTYVDNLNTLIEGTEFKNKPLESIIIQSKGKIYQNAVQHYAHSFFWKCMSPNKQDVPDEIKGKFDKEKFIDTAVNHFGSGWVGLVITRDGNIKIRDYNVTYKPNIDEILILIVDVWEHAYYLLYPADKKAYLKAFWKVINWEFVLQNYNKALGDK